jgi:hypothetical protein
MPENLVGVFAAFKQREFGMTVHVVVMGIIMCVWLAENLTSLLHALPS